METDTNITREEGVFTIYNEKGELIAMSKRDDESKKHLVYLVREATSSDIIDLIKNK
jgi:hypothetical protein